MSRVVRGVYANIRATPKMAQADVVEDLLTLQGTNPEWVALNEAAKVRRYRRAIRRLFHDEDWRYVALSRRKRNAVLIRRDKHRVLATRVVRLNKGLPGVNPARKATCVLLQDRETRRQFWLVCVHLLNGKDKPHRRRWRWRARTWPKSWRRFCGLLEGLTAHGVPVVVAGDLNDKHTPAPIRGWDWYSPNGRIVKVGGTVKHATARTVSSVATDHPAIVVRLPL